MFRQTVAILAEAEENGFGAPHADHNHVLVGVSVFLVFVFLMLVTLAFNRDH